MGWNRISFGRVSRLLSGLFLAVVFLSGCASPPPAQSNSANQMVLSERDPNATGAQIALLTYDAQQDKPLTQSTWTTISRFCGEEGLTCGIYRVAQKDPLSTLELAIKGGAKLVVAIGDELLPTLQKANDLYPELQCIVVDSQAENTVLERGMLLHFDEVQGGWLAGYAAILDGGRAITSFYSKDAVAKRYLLGFLFGAEYAAQQTGMEPGTVQVQLVGDELPLLPEETADMLRQRLDEPPGYIFCALPELQPYVEEAAEGTDTRIIGVELDISSAVSQVAASVRKSSRRVLQDCLSDWVHRLHFSQSALVCGIDEEAIVLSFEASRFERFSQQSYDMMIYHFMQNHVQEELAQAVLELRISSPADFAGIPFEYVTVTIV